LNGSACDILGPTVGALVSRGKLLVIPNGWRRPSRRLNGLLDIVGVVAGRGTVEDNPFLLVAGSKPPTKSFAMFESEGSDCKSEISVIGTPASRADISPPIIPVARFKDSCGSDSDFVTGNKSADENNPAKMSRALLFTSKLPESDDAESPKEDILGVGITIEGRSS